jgi:hypothetical protein
LQRKPPSDSELIAVGLAKTDKYKYMVTCYADTSFHIWSTKGELLHTVDTKLMNNNYLAVSPW